MQTIILGDIRTAFKASEDDIRLRRGFGSFVAQILRFIISDKSYEGLKLSAQLLKDSASNTWLPEIPHDIIWKFYDHTWELDQYRQAMDVYQFLRRPEILERRQYPPPKGRAVEWLLYGFLGRAHNMQGAKVLVEHLYRDDRNLSIHDVMMVISQCCQRGFWEAALALWKRHTAHESKEKLSDDRLAMRTALYGSPKVMLKMVKLLKHLETRAYSRAGESEDGNATPFLERIDIKNQLVEMPSPEECIRLARFIISKHIEVKGPMEKATRHDINALSRAYFVLGNVEEGLATMKILLDHGMIPQAHDISVMLSGMAAIDPRRAARMMQRMLDRGLKPEKVDFGALLHEASTEGDDVLVGMLMHKAQEVGIGQLSSRAIHTLVQRSLRFGQAGEAEQPVEAKETLERALAMMSRMEFTDHVATPALGARCVRASLGVNQAELAYQFWRRFVAGKVDGTSMTQRTLRGQLRSGVAKAIKHGWTTRRRASAMFAEMGDQDGIRPDGE
ncbi:hypothetical protein SISSUDRAFT_976641 [Sistotremastrum suecicum HHB10207 ss-3]|uniref:Pentacotripeptide-repeat region of PRORP domain-containing protein n=1 Tax=Sistotremastrum suecicum HHB10207 ss-3 TaxID=1314776 RepID=A0A166J699_9AGAM|nr:hypothetical protein SISSUDRAFT_976641 [Sistotremastrum suecicum HHB10207 ss-3]